MIIRIVLLLLVSLDLSAAVVGGGPTGAAINKMRTYFPDMALEGVGEGALVRLILEETKGFNPPAPACGFAGIGSNPMTMPAGKNAVDMNNACYVGTLFTPAVGAYGDAWYVQNNSTQNITIKTNRTNMDTDLVLVPGYVAGFSSNGTVWNTGRTVPSAIANNVRSLIGSKTVVGFGSAGQILTTDGAGSLSWINNLIGDVVGPAVAVDNSIPRYDGTTGKLIQGSGVIIDDTNNITAPGYLRINLAGGTNAGNSPTGLFLNDTNAQVVGNSTPRISFANGGAENTWIVGLLEDTNSDDSGILEFWSHAGGYADRRMAKMSYSSFDVLSSLTAGGNLSVTGTSTLTGNTTVGGTLAVTGQTTFNTGANSVTFPIFRGIIGQVLTAGASGSTNWSSLDPNYVTNAGVSVDNAIARFDATTGKIIQNSGVIISDTNGISGVATLQVGTVNNTNVGAKRIEITGPQASANGPHMSFNSDGDNYPIRYFLNYSHDNSWDCWDCYWDGAAFRNSTASSSFRWSKTQTDFILSSVAAPTAGGTEAQTNRFWVNENGGVYVAGPLYQGGNPIDAASVVRIIQEETRAFSQPNCQTPNGWGGAGGAGANPLVPAANINCLFVGDGDWVSTAYLPAVGANGALFYYVSGAQFTSYVAPNRTDQFSNIAYYNGQIATYRSNGTLWVLQGVTGNTGRQLIGSTTQTGNGTAGQVLSTNGAGSLSWVANASDIKLKKDIIELEDAKSIIDSLVPVSFYWNEKGLKFTGQNSKRHVGLIAQDVEKILPGSIKGDDIKILNYDEITAALVKYVQQQNEFIKKLEKRILILESK